VVDPGPGRRGRAHDPLGVLGQRLDPGQQQVAKDRRQVGAVRAGGQQLLGEEGVALGAGQDVADQPRRGPVAEDPGDQVGQLAPGQAGQLDLLGPAGPLQLGQEGPQRVAAVQLVGAVGEDQGHAGPEVAHQVSEQVAGGPVGPVQVLDHQQDGTAGGQAVEDPEEQLEQPPWGRARRRPRGGRRRDQLGDQAGELDAGAAEHAVQLGRVEVGGQLPERLGQRRVRQRPVADVEAATAEHGHAGRLGLAGQLGDQPGLADPGLARHDHGDRGPGRRPLGGGPEPGELGGAAGQDGAGDALGDAADLARRRRARPPAVAGHARSCAVLRR
jgi:hypothetical protein